MRVVIPLIIAFFILLGIYTVIGVPTNVEKIKKLAPQSISERGWKILRYEGYEYGSWYYHGGKVWYHVADTGNYNIQYRIFITLWSDELHYTYGAPEVLERVNVNYK